MESFRLRKQFEYSLERIFENNSTLIYKPVVDVKTRCFQQFSELCPFGTLDDKSQDHKSVRVKNIFRSHSFLVHIVTRTIALLDTQKQIKTFHPAYPLIVVLRTCVFAHLKSSAACKAIIEFIHSHSSAISRFCLGLLNPDGSFPEIRILIWQQLLTLTPQEIQKYFPWIHLNNLSKPKGHVWGLLLPHYSEVSADDLSDIYANAMNTHNPINMAIAEYDIRMVDSYLMRKKALRSVS